MFVDSMCDYMEFICFTDNFGHNSSWLVGLHLNWVLLQDQKITFTFPPFEKYFLLGGRPTNLQMKLIMSPEDFSNYLDRNKKKKK